MRVSAFSRNVKLAHPSHSVRPSAKNIQPRHLRLLATTASKWPTRPRRLLLLAGALGLSTWISLQPWKPTSYNSPLNPNTFSRYVILNRISDSSTSSIFTLTPLEGSRPDAHASANVSILETLFREYLWSIQIKQPQLQIAREYTPLPLNEEQKREYGDEAFQLLIRREEQGEVSGWLHRLPIGAQIDIRGPRSTHRILGDVEEIVFLAGGTGIAPALQLAHGLLAASSSTSRKATDDAKSLPRLSILWANRRREDCAGGVNAKPKSGNGWLRWWPWAKANTTTKDSKVDSKTSVIVEQLEALKEAFKGQLEVQYFVDEERSFITQDVLRSALVPLVRRENMTTISGTTRSDAKRLIIVSGPDGFVRYFAGAKGQFLGPSEGEGMLQDVLRDVGAERGWQIWKL